MSEGLNRVQLLGNLGQDPELRFTQGGQAVLNMRVACNERYQDRDKEWKERTEWVSVALWGKRAEALGERLGKGARIFVEGSLRTSSYEGRDGQKRYRTEVNARNVIVVTWGDGEQQPRDTQAKPQQQAKPKAGWFAGPDDDDIPF